MTRHFLENVANQHSVIDKSQLDEAYFLLILIGESLLIKNLHVNQIRHTNGSFKIDLMSNFRYKDGRKPSKMTFTTRRGNTIHIPTPSLVSVYDLSGLPSEEYIFDGWCVLEDERNEIMQWSGPIYHVSLPKY